MVLFGALAMIVADAPHAHAQGILDPGERAFSYCYSCHSVDPNETQFIPGPNLFGIVGRRIAALENFPYSPAFREFAEDQDVWTMELIAEWMKDPQTMAPGSLMEMPPGPPTQEERQFLLEYLQKQH